MKQVEINPKKLQKIVPTDSSNCSLLNPKMLLEDAGTLITFTGLIFYFHAHIRITSNVKGKAKIW